MKKMIRLIIRWIAVHLLPKVAYPVISGPLSGLKIILGAASGPGGGASVYLGLVEPKQTYAFKKSLEKGSVLFDVGANIGYYTLLGSRIVGETGKIFAFEPSIRNIEYLTKHIRINKIKNATIIPAACSDMLSVSLFDKTSDCALGHFVEDSEVQKSNYDIVPTITIDTIAKRTGVFPEVIKIDVEGAELKVLNGSISVLREKHPVLFLSVHSNHLRNSCLEFLKQFNYSAEPLDKSENGEPYEFMLSCNL